MSLPLEPYTVIDLTRARSGPTCVRQLAEMGFRIIATRGTKRHLDAHGIPCEKVNKVLEGRPHIVDAITNGEVDIVFNTTEGAKALADSFAFCDDAFSATTDENAVQFLKQGQNEVTRASVLFGVLIHGNEMFGTSNVYLRSKGIVPASTERAAGRGRGNNQ